jgi:hypothetical protein
MRVWNAEDSHHRLGGGNKPRFGVKNLTLGGVGGLFQTDASAMLRREAEIALPVRAMRAETKTSTSSFGASAGAPSRTCRPAIRPLRRGATASWSGSREAQLLRHSGLRHTPNLNKKGRSGGRKAIPAESYFCETKPPPAGGGERGIAIIAFNGQSGLSCLA